MADTVSDGLGDNIFGETLADNIRGEDGNLDEYEQEKRMWRSHLQDETFRSVVFELAWINLEGTFPDEMEEPLDDWV